MGKYIFHKEPILGGGKAVCKNCGKTLFFYEDKTPLNNDLPSCPGVLVEIKCRNRECRQVNAIRLRLCGRQISFE